MTPTPLPTTPQLTKDEPTAPSLFTIGEVAAWLRVDERTVRRRIKDGSIRKVPLGGRAVRISSEEMARLTGDDRLNEVINHQVISGN